MTSKTTIHSYHLLSEIYDPLAAIWSLGHISKSRNEAIKRILNFPDVLVIGPGTCTGFHDFEKGRCSLTLIDSSPEMLAKNENAWSEEFKNKLTTHTCDIRSFKPRKLYDCIWLPYFLNVFSREEVVSLLSTFKSWLKKDGEIHISDFMAPDPRRIHRLLQEVWHGLPMAFFHVVTGNAWHSIHDLPKLASAAGLKEIEIRPTGFGPKDHPWIGNFVCRTPSTNF